MRLVPGPPGTSFPLFHLPIILLHPMRPLHFKLLAAVVLAAAVLLVTRRSGDAPAAQATTPPARQAAHGSLATALSKPPLTPAKAENIHSLPGPAADDAASAAAAPVETSPAGERGVQVAENVRLPAAVLALNKMDPATTPAPILAATRQIVDSYYSSLLKATAGSTAAQASGGDGSNTTVIQPGPVADRARNEADQMYRALFGDQAFNQMGINSALEVRASAQGGGH